MRLLPVAVPLLWLEHVHDVTRLNHVHWPKDIERVCSLELVNVISQRGDVLQRCA
jgi:hypothetical protein